MYSVETNIKIFNDKTGEKIEVGPDVDGLGLVQITVGTSEIIISPEEALLLAQVIQKLYFQEEQK